MLRANPWFVLMMQVLVLMHFVVLRLLIPRVLDSLFDSYHTNLEIGHVPNILHRYLFYTDILCDLFVDLEIGITSS